MQPEQGRDEVKPCPHCGSKDVEHVLGASNGKVFKKYVECCNCGAMAKESWWNIRAKETPDVG